MIIVKIQHGLGNQMFQYAAGLAMAKRNGTELKLDVSAYAHPNKNDTPRKFLLDRFNISAEIASEAEIRAFRANNFSGASVPERAIRKLFKKAQEKKPAKDRSYIAENGFGFRPELLENKNKDVYLYGGWQNENYFKDAENLIREEFTLKNGLGESASEIAEKIKNTASVSVHIRRGDYESNPKTKTRLGPLPPEYYGRAMEIASKKVPSPVFFVFSDDTVWAKKNLPADFKAVFASGEGLSDCEELVLMSKCGHNIIANSSFSWWGAWLNLNPEKIVIAPKRWFADPRNAGDNPCPPGWIKI